MTTKTRELRRTKDHSIRIIRSDGQQSFMLFERDKMVRVRDWSNAEGGFFKTFYTHSLPWTIVRRIVKRLGRSGRTRDGWSFYHAEGYLKIGCQKFTGTDYTTLVAWAQGR
jgi:hypothetical protein